MKSEKEIRLFRLELLRLSRMWERDAVRNLRDVDPKTPEDAIKSFHHALNYALDMLSWVLGDGNATGVKEIMKEVEFADKFVRTGEKPPKEKPPKQWMLQRQKEGEKVRERLEADCQQYLGVNLAELVESLKK